MARLRGENLRLLTSLLCTVLLAACAPREEPVENRLAGESSPYLLQHAHNPVDWYPWGEEAFEKARREEKPIFLSVGYSTCHWCHVMERESFQDEEVAALLNEHFVAVKVDREERPDVDEVYMTAVLVATGSGGWPQTTILTPEGKPFFAGTYFPKPRLMELLPRVARLWAERRDQAQDDADRLTAQVVAAVAQRSEPADQLSRAPLEAALERVRRAGVDGPAPRFPQHHTLALLLESGDPDAVEKACESLRDIALGGVRDHLGGGFHRYSTDAEWHLPHFEKTLYDNALLLRNYALAYERTRDPLFAEAARGIAAWLEGSMTDPQGGLYSAMDADSEGEEGRYYVWTAEEVRSLLDGDAQAWFLAAYGVEEAGNFRDEATGQPTGANVLDPPEAPAGKLSPAAMQEARSVLLRARSARVPPMTDDKVLADWNGLAVGALARASTAFGEPGWLERSRRAAAFVTGTMRSPEGLLHTYRQGRAYGPAFLEDHAFLIDGLLDLHDASGEARWLEEARSVADAMVAAFHDAESGGFYQSSANHEALIARLQNGWDGALPSGNGMAARSLARLARATGSGEYAELARGVLRRFAREVVDRPEGYPTLLRTLALEEPAEPVLEARSEHVAVKAVPPPPGDEGIVKVVFEIQPGWHVGAGNPLGSAVRATIVRPKEGPVRAGPPIAPPGEEMPVAFAGGPLSVYTGRVVFRIPVHGSGLLEIDV